MAKTTQQALSDNNLDRFMAVLNDHLLQGCRVVPGTFYCGSQQLVARDSTPDWFKLPDGSTFYKIFFVVLEYDETPPDRPTPFSSPEAIHDHAPGPHVHP